MKFKAKLSQNEYWSIPFTCELFCMHVYLPLHQPTYNFWLPYLLPLNCWCMNEFFSILNIIILFESIWGKNCGIYYIWRYYMNKNNMVLDSKSETKEVILRMMMRNFNKNYVFVILHPTESEEFSVILNWIKTIK